MSVYTTIKRHELKAFLSHYALGELVDYQGINAGIENTNYFVNTSEGKFVLTIFESLSAQELPYFLDLMAYFAEHDVPSAHPLADEEKHYLRKLKGKPAALVRRLFGSSTEDPSVEQCADLGRILGHMHTVGQGFPGRRVNERSLSWWRETAERLMPLLSDIDAELLEEEIRFQSLHPMTDLPQGVIHADLFRDNALFMDAQLTGIIDFYYACNDALLYDVAVSVNDWCCYADGSIDEKRVSALLDAYAKERQFEPNEDGAWPVMLRAAALRFWLSRLQDRYFPRDGEITHIKDPEMLKRILQQRIAQHTQLKLT